MVDGPKIIGKRLAALREALDIEKQSDFAAAIGVTKQTYNPWEKGSRPLTFDGACKIRAKFKIPLDYLFYGDGADQLPARIYNKIQRAA